MSTKLPLGADTLGEETGCSCQVQEKDNSSLTRAVRPGQSGARRRGCWGNSECGSSQCGDFREEGNLNEARRTVGFGQADHFPDRCFPPTHTPAPSLCCYSTSSLRPPLNTHLQQNRQAFASCHGLCYHLMEVGSGREEQLDPGPVLPIVRQRREGWAHGAVCRRFAKKPQAASGRPVHEEHRKPGGAGQTPPEEIGRATQSHPHLEASADQHPAWSCLLPLTLTAPQIPSF